MAKMTESTKTGLISGIVAGGLLIGMTYSPRDYVAWFQYGSIISFVAGSYVAVKRTRDLELPDKNLEFKQGLKAGVKAGAIASLIMAVIQFFLWSGMNVRENIAEMRNGGLDDATIRNGLRNMTDANFLQGAIFMCIVNIIISFFMSVMATMVLKKKPV